MKLQSLLFALLLLPRLSHAFCGFYVAKADSSLFNKASQVVLVHDGDRTAISMLNDYRGELTDFALVVPVPSVLAKEQINVGDKSLFERVDAYSAPRLVEFFDPDPCEPKPMYDAVVPMAGGMRASRAMKLAGNSLGVKVEAQYTIGEYDIVILSAKESTGLETWLHENGYKVPKNAARALEPYIKQDMKFFVAKVNLKEQAKTGFTFLRPIQFAFESPKYMLPIRLGMVNSDGPQDLIVYAITKKGRVETTNYRTVKLPTGFEVPEYIKGRFVDFYKALFDVAHEKENKKVVFQEYAWNMGWCDPCAADPLNKEELRKLGVFWPEENSGESDKNKMRIQGIKPNIVMPNAPAQAYITRLHLRYDRDHFPEDLFFQETPDNENYQGRYIMNHPWTGTSKCPMADTYKMKLKDRRKKEAENVSHYTGWKIADVYKEMGSEVIQPVNDQKKWYEKIFK